MTDCERNQKTCMEKVSRVLRITQCISASVAIFFGALTFGGLGLTVLLDDMRCLQVVCMTAGISLASSLWWRLSQRINAAIPLTVILLVTFCAIAGAALHANTTYLLWVAGLPTGIGTVPGEKMGETYWLPPVMLMLAVFQYTLLKREFLSGGRQNP